MREEAEKAKIVIAAQAQAEKESTIAQGHASAILKEYMANAEGTTYVDLSLAYPLGESGWTILAHAGKTTFSGTGSLAAASASWP